ncbi:MAG TPA: D-alanyl-D-alanine carboxypeptidase/D-alanyl-D-alanine-endopeptidase [Phycisphaerae bacterium]|nr:D-alanyl-D-alanine carboxypeptidase/D-alanyl-D-alanine-endopeptidase [Phycisphaerae bacterium]
MCRIKKNDFTILFAFFIAFACLASHALQARAQTLSDRIAALLSSKQLAGAQVAIDMRELVPTGSQEVYSLHPDLPLMPGSNAKVLTTAAAFDRFGADYDLPTRLYIVGNDLVVVGGGDPALGDPVLSQYVGWKPTTPFEIWAGILKKKGLTHFDNLYIDDSIFDHQFTNPLWPSGQSSDWYEAPVGGLNYSLNVKPTPGNADGTAVDDPGLYAGSAIWQTFTANGITFDGQLLRGSLTQLDASGQAKPLATFETPLPAILRRAHTDSINLMAEALCKLLGHDATGRPGSWADGIAAIQAYLKSLGISQDMVTLADGSGLSHSDRIAPEALTMVLAHIASEPDAAVYINSMARPGSGTLIHRFIGSPAARDIYAKDGHITGASTLCGYLFVDGRKFVFSVMVNHYHGNVNSWEDQVVTALYFAASGKP